MNETGATDSIAKTDFMVIVIFVTSFIKMLFVTTLLIFHVNYILKGLTTYVSNKYEELIAYHGNIYSGRSVKINIYNRLIKKNSHKFDFRLLNTDSTFLMNESRSELSSNRPKIEGLQGYSSVMNASEEDKLVKSSMVNNYITINTNKLEINPGLITRNINSEYIPSNSPPLIPISKMDTNNIVYTDNKGLNKKRQSYEEHNGSLGSSNRRLTKHRTAKATKKPLNKLAQRKKLTDYQAKEKMKENNKYRNNAFGELLSVGSRNLSPNCKPIQAGLPSQNKNKYSFDIINSEGSIFSRPKLKLK